MTDATRPAREALELITAVYTAGLSLPPLPPAPDGRQVSASRDDLHAIIFRNAAKLPLQYYGELHDPLPVPPKDEPLLGDLADDIADIYLDVSEGLALYDNGDTDGAVYAWEFGMWHHWGEHATSAIRTLHMYVHANE